MPSLKIQVCKSGGARLCRADPSFPSPFVLVLVLSPQGGTRTRHPNSTPTSPTRIPSARVRVRVRVPPSKTALQGNPSLPKTRFPSSRSTPSAPFPNADGVAADSPGSAEERGPPGVHVPNAPRTLKGFVESPRRRDRYRNRDRAMLRLDADTDSDTDVMGRGQLGSILFILPFLSSIKLDPSNLKLSSLHHPAACPSFRDSVAPMNTRFVRSHRIPWNPPKFPAPVNPTLWPIRTRSRTDSDGNPCSRYS